jgi:hypothetical protein
MLFVFLVGIEPTVIMQHALAARSGEGIAILEPVKGLRQNRIAPGVNQAHTEFGSVVRNFSPHITEIQRPTQ